MRELPDFLNHLSDEDLKQLGYLRGVAHKLYRMELICGLDPYLADLQKCIVEGYSEVLGEVGMLVIGEAELTESEQAAEDAQADALLPKNKRQDKTT